MSGLILPARNLVQPLHNAAVDDYWRQRKPRSIYLPTSLRPVDVMRRYPVTDASSTATMNTGAVGRLWDFGAGSTTSRIVTPTDSLNSIGGVTIVAVIRPTSFAALASICSTMSTAINGLQWRITTSGNLEAVCAGVAVLSTDTAALTVNRWSTVALRILTGSGARSTFATNGIIGASPTTDTTATMNGAGAIGERYTGSSQPFVGQMALLAQFDTLFSDADLRSITAQPWQLFKAPARRIWIGAGGGAPAGSGTVATTGGGGAAAIGRKAQSAAMSAIGAGADSATGRKSSTAAILGAGSGAATATGSKVGGNALSALNGGLGATTGQKSAGNVHASAGAGSGAYTGRKAASTAVTVRGAGFTVATCRHGGAGSYTGTGAGSISLALSLDRYTTISTGGGGLGATTGKHGGASSSVVSGGGAGSATARHAGKGPAVGAGGGRSAFVGLKSQVATVTFRAAGLAANTAVSGTVIEYARAPIGGAQELIYRNTARPPVISGTRPGNINTARPANRGGRRT